MDSEDEEFSVTAGSPAPSTESDFDVFGVSGPGLCTCGSSGRSHKRDCPLNLRKRCPQQAAVPVPPSPNHDPVKVNKPPTNDIAPKMEVGDHVCVHSKSMGKYHLPCRIVNVLGGRYQLYCTKGVLVTSFCATELSPLASDSVIPIENWRKAPRVSLRSAIEDTTLIQGCNCDVPDFDSTLISSASEGKSETLELWVNNTAYSLSHRDKEIIASPDEWLTDKIVNAGQMLLLQFYSRMAWLQPPALQQVLAFQVHSEEFVQIVHVMNSHWCMVSTVGCESGVVRMTACIRLHQMIWCT